MSCDVDACHDAAIALAREAGKIITAAIAEGPKRDIQTKESYADLVTETDREVEKFLFSNLTRIFPEHKFIGEESTASGQKCELTDAPTWIIDPIDGTTNFVHGFPYVAISMGLTVKKEVILGVVYNPLLEKMYTARRGQGAFCNGAMLRVSGQEDLTKALLIVEVGGNRSAEKMDLVTHNMSKLMRQSQSIRAMGSAALDMCAIASGHADAYFEFGIHCWDVAAGKLIVEEAGGFVMDTQGGPFDMMSRRMLCASSHALAMTVSKQLRHMQLERD